MFNLYEIYAAELWFELVTPGSAVRCSTDCGTQPRKYAMLYIFLINLFCTILIRCHSIGSSWNKENIMFFLSKLFGPCQAKTCLEAYADSEGLDQPAHPCSLIRTLTVRKQIHWILLNVSMESKGPDKTLGMYRMMWIRRFEVILLLDAAHFILSSAAMLLTPGTSFTIKYCKCFCWIG